MFSTWLEIFVPFLSPILVSPFYLLQFGLSIVRRVLVPLPNYEEGIDVTVVLP